MDLEANQFDEDIEVDMSPMIDMVFLLLIFFIVASAIVDDKPVVEVPSAVYAKVPDDIKGRVMITVKKDGSLYIGNNRNPVSIEEVKGYLAPQMESNEKTLVMIRADKNVKYKVNEKLVEACGEVGASDMIYTAFEE